MKRVTLHNIKLNHWACLGDEDMHRSYASDYYIPQPSPISCQWLNYLPNPFILYARNISLVCKQKSFYNYE